MILLPIKSLVQWPLFGLVTGQAQGGAVCGFGLVDAAQPAQQFVARRVVGVTGDQRHGQHVEFGQPQGVRASARSSVPVSVATPNGRDLSDERPGACPAGSPTMAE